MKAGEKIIINRACDRLDPVRRERLEDMVDEIEKNLDEVMREKAEYFKQVNSLDTASKQSKLTQMSNAYSFFGNLKSEMDSIDTRIRQCNPDA
jgi:dsDNA-specific endonuclease/ATPase MutS2